MMVVRQDPSMSRGVRSSRSRRCPFGRDPQVTTTEMLRGGHELGTLKSMIPLLVRVVAKYETELGQIPAPPFDQDWR